MKRRQLLYTTALGTGMMTAGCSGSDDSDGNKSTDETGAQEAAVELEYSITAGETPEQIPEGIRNSRDEGGRRQEGNQWVVITFEVVNATLDMEDVWFRSRVETSDRFYDLDHATSDLSDGVQSRGEIKEGGTGIALYQVPADAKTYDWNLEKMRQDIDAERK